MNHRLLAAAAAFAFSLPAAAQEAPSPPSPGEIAAAAPANDWVAIAASDLLVMDLVPDAAGKPRRVVIQLMPAPFVAGWVGNIRKLAAAHWWDGTSVNRVQDNYVAQWGDATEKKALPEGLATVPESDYVLSGGAAYSLKRLIVDHERALMADPYWRGGGYGFANGMPVALDDVRLSGLPDPNPAKAWPIHCYGAVGVGRNLSPDTGSGAELYTVIGHAPRHLDRNIAVVGRVIAGIEYLSSLPRGTGGLGFYEDEKERVPIASIRIASDLPAADQPKFEYLSTDSSSFQRYANARANRRDAFFNIPAGGADICNIPVPVRAVK